MFGDGSLATPEAGAWRVLGLWVLECGGVGRFEAGATAVLPDLPVAGELIMSGLAPMALHCFSQACSFPKGACFRLEAEKRIRILHCEGGAAMPAAALKTPGPEPPGSDAVIVVVGGRPLVVRPADSGSLQRPARPSASACCGQEPTRAVISGAATAPASTAVHRSTAPTLSEASGSAAQPTGDSNDRSYVLEIPEPPSDGSCDTMEALRTESRRMVESGNEAVLAGEIQRAIDEYRAALTLHLCNPYAWADLGAVALQLDRPAEAVLALTQAVELQPRHYTAYTNLGLAYESLGQYGFAREAFRVALSVRPHHAPALEGLGRVQAR